jgi:hypothetical protein
VKAFQPNAQLVAHPVGRAAFCREFTTIERREPLQRLFLKQSMVVLLNIGGKCSLFRAKVAHFSGYLPAWFLLFDRRLA